MAPKGKGKEEPVAAPPPVDSLGLVAWSDEALAAENFACDPPFEDALGTRLPEKLYCGMATFQRPSEFLADALADGETLPCVVQPPAASEDGSPPPLTRTLPNVLVSKAAMAAEASPAVQWLTSCFQLVALQAELLDEGTFLWELIYPKGEDGLPAYQAGGKYAVKLWEQGQWRMIVVDDRMPIDSSGELLVPTSTNALELWPLLLAKALYKLAEPYATSVSQDPAVLLRLTGWLPEVVPISPTLPAEASYEVLAQYLAPEMQCALGVLLPEGSDESLAAVGLCHGPLVAVRDVRPVDDSLYIRLESELLQWSGELRDTDEATWTPPLADALSWKRLQRLRKHAAGWPLHDWWLSLASLNAHFSAVLVLHKPSMYGCVASHSGEATHAGAPASLLHVPAAAEDDPEPYAEVLLGLAARPKAPDDPPADADPEAPPPPPPPPFGTCMLSVALSEWGSPSEPPALLRVPTSSASAVSVTLIKGRTYALTPLAELPDGYGEVADSGGYVPEEPPAAEPPAAEEDAEVVAAVAEGGGEGEEAPAEGDGAGEEAAPEEEAAGEPAAPPAPPPPPEARACHYTLTACCGSDVFLGDAPTITSEQLGLKVASVAGTTAALPAGEWTVGVAASLKPAEACGLAASLSFAEADVASCARFYLVGEDDRQEISFLGLATGEVALDPATNPSGYLLLADLKSPVDLPASAWTLTLHSSAELTAAAVEPKPPPASLADAYPPNEDYRLFRLVVGTAVKTTGSVHVTCTTADATVVVRALQYVGDAPPVELCAASGLGCATLMALPVEPPPAAAAKGQEPPPQTTLIVEGCIDRLSALSLSVPTKPPPPPPEGEEAPPGLEWAVTAMAAQALTLSKDPAREAELAALSKAWEDAAPGRAAKAKESRDKYLAELEAAAAPPEAAEDGAEETAPPPAPVPTSQLPNVAFKGSGGAGVVWAADEKESWGATQAAKLEELAEARAAAEETRGGIREAMGAQSTGLIEATKAKRTEKQDAYAEFARQREELLTKLLPAPPEPAEPVDAKKGKKK